MLSDVILDPSSLADLFRQLGALKGPIGLIALVVFFTIRLYRLPAWQGSLPPGIRWENIPSMGKYGLIGALAALGAVLTSMSQGLSWQDATAAAIAAALTAMAAHEITTSAPVQAVAQVVVPPPKPEASTLIMPPQDKT